MKLLLPTLLCLAVFSTVMVDAGKKNVRHRKRYKMKQKGDKSRCKYYCEPQVSACDPVKLTQTVTFPLKKGVNCPLRRVYTQLCGQGEDVMGDKSYKGCKYDRQGAQWTACGPGVLSKSKVMMLLDAQPTSCPPTKTKTVPCKKGKNKADKKKKKKNKGKGKGKGKACKYQKGAWSECDMATNQRTRELTLRKGDENMCLPKKVITKKCKKPCKYTKGPWSPCNEATNEKTRQLTLKKGDPTVCNATSVIVKSCRRRDAFTAAKTSQCKYKPLGWSECDVRTNTMTRTLKLKSGDPALCQQTKELTRKCRKACKFSKGEWTACDQATGLKSRTDRLVKGGPVQCEATRVISRKCGMDGDCKYAVGDWGECDAVTKERTRVKTLVTGDREKCHPEIRVTRPCFKPSGEASCFLGTWGEYGPCQNGVMMKHRPVVAGGVECERKAVKTKPCSP